MNYKHKMDFEEKKTQKFASWIITDSGKGGFQMNMFGLPRNSYKTTYIRKIEKSSKSKESTYDIQEEDKKRKRKTHQSYVNDEDTGNNLNLLI